MNLTRVTVVAAPLAAILATGCGGAANSPQGMGSSSFANDLGGSAPGRRTPEPTVQPDLGENADLRANVPMGSESAWRVSVDKLPAEGKLALEGPLSLGFGKEKGYTYHVVGNKAKKTDVAFPKGSFDGDFVLPEKPSDPLIVLERESNRVIEATGLRKDGEKWVGTRSVRHDLRTGGKSGAPLSVSGLPLFAGLVRVDETMGLKEIGHALAFAAPTVGEKDGIVPGARYRLRADFDTKTFSPAAQTIVNALKRYGMVAVDKGPKFALLGVKDAKWVDEDLAPLSTLQASDFAFISAFGKEPRPVKRTPEEIRTPAPTTPSLPSPNPASAGSKSGPANSGSAGAADARLNRGR